MTYAQDAPAAPASLSTYHRGQLERARSYLESIAARHPEWVIRKVRR